MFQETHSVQGHDNKIVNKANPHFGQSFVSVLQIFGGVIRKVAAGMVIGLHSLVENAEQHRPTQNEFWWESRDCER